MPTTLTKHERDIADVLLNMIKSRADKGPDCERYLSPEYAAVFDKIKAGAV
jgi:hypothetical protein